MAVTNVKRTAPSAISRRRLVQAAGTATGLTIAWSTAALARQGAGTPIAPPLAGGTPSAPDAGATPQATPAPQAEESPFSSQVDAYLRVEEDGSVTLMVGKVEYGQGIATGFGQLIAEELSVPFESVTVVMGETDVVPFDIGTFGSLSTRLTGPRLRQAGAAMRHWLLELGAEELGVAVDDLTLDNGSVVGGDGASVDLATLAAGRSAERTLDPDLPLKDPATFTVIGQSIPRPDVASKVDGSILYGIDASVVGMAWGAIVRPPRFGATLTDIDFSAAEAMPGFVGSFSEGDFAGVVAERFEQAQAAAATVEATWDEPEDGIDALNVFDLLLETADEGEPLGEDTGPADAENLTDAIVEPLELTFRAPFVNHAPIEPRVALAGVTDDAVEVWSSTQDPFGARAAVAEALGRDEATVVVRAMASGGAFGAKIIAMADVEAARLSQAVGRPVKVLWNRTEEFTHGQYRPAMLVNIVTGLDGDGAIAGWQYDLYSASYFPAGSGERNGAAADWSADLREIYDVTASRTMWFHADAPLPPYFWRVNGATTNTWAREVTMDILAEQAGLDPITFRRNHLGAESRAAAVMDAAVELAGWEPGVGSTGQGFGIALGYDANTFVAEVARVELDEETGEVLVRHVDVAIDCGLVVNPGAVVHQVEGSVVMGTSSTLREIIQFENGLVSNASFAEYAPITMRETPTVAVTFVENKEDPMGGVGEPAVAPTTGAIANALYDLTGVRLFDTPFTPDRVLAALEEQAG